MDSERKYFFYESSVQNPEGDVEFINEKFQELRGKKPYSLREDFGGTGLLCCHWVKQGASYSASVVDLDSEPINYGKRKNVTKLSPRSTKRITYHQKNVLDVRDISSDVVVAFNFSYFTFKHRRELLEYFSEVKKSLKPGGVFFLDCFGGSECYTPIEEETEFDDFSYFWDLHSFDPIANHVIYYIHFKEKRKVKQKKVFSYDWRMWSLPELKEILHEVGFKDVTIYWEGDDEDGSGNGLFTPCQSAEQCDSWVVYLAAY